MFKKAMAAAAVAASVVGVSAAFAPQALAIGNDGGVTTTDGNGAAQVYGNGETKGDMSPQASLVQGTANKLCVGLPAKADVQSVVGIIANVGVQDIPVLSAPQNQQCAENSTQAKGDEPLSHIVDNIPVLSGNGAKDS
ncbi:rodlin [Streptomyces cylindrosporus]|uniref:RdlA protein n=1 Tax=Streptomyces cylindrosporus TaxID=2927583 RepID=A0ABS9Y0J1_9ACTN|nr:rodlin [Streptomyces cylindrosporus]MCI3269506.1 RdlA protein [Streptomyces cylindrosporus]